MSAAPPTADDPPRPDLDDAFIAVVETYANAPDECTIYPDSPEYDRVTEWVSAEAGGFVALDEMR